MATKGSPNKRRKSGDQSPAPNRGKSPARSAARAPRPMMPDDLKDILDRSILYLRFCNAAWGFTEDHKMYVGGGDLIVGADDIGERVRAYIQDDEKEQVVFRRCSELKTPEAVDGAIFNAKSLQPCVIILAELDRLQENLRTKVFESMAKLTSDGVMYSLICTTEVSGAIFSENVKKCLAISVLAEVEQKH